MSTESSGRSGRRTLALILVPAMVVAVAVVAVVRAHVTSNPSNSRYSAQIRRTEYGIPHVTAKDYGSLGYGYGYAFAQDNLCVMASWVVTLRGERSRYFGPRAASDDPIQPDDGQADNLTSDIYYKGLRESGVLRRTLARPAPLGPTGELHAAGRWLCHAATTAICMTQEWGGCRIRPAGARPGFGRSPQWTSGPTSSTSTAWTRPASSRAPSPPPSRPEAARPGPGGPHRPPLRRGRRPLPAATGGRWAGRRPATATECCSPTRTCRGTVSAASIRCS